MTVTDQLVPGSAPLDEEGAALREAAADHLWLHFSRQSVLEEHGVPIIVRGEGHHIFDDRGKQYIDGLSGLFVVNAGHGRRRLAEAAAKQATELAFFPLWSYAHPSAIRLAERLADEAPGRPEPRVLLHRRRRGRRDGLQAREALLQGHRQADEAQGDLPRGGVPRHPARRARADGHPGDEADVRAPRARRVPGAEHEHLPRRGDERADGSGGVRPLGRRPHRGADPLRGPGDGRRRLPRAGAERRRLLPAPSRLLPAGAPDLRQVRRAARLRRGHLRVRPHRRDLRLQRLRLRRPT